ncbi:hypothetical protein [[Clostridium] symbiosum]|uniref:hypothetical protein n=1 Tax=Clostridium symbiosum TaxID=1512 RepID=UPI00189B169D|nr:hypothetical protein [[Clostridium] symbiosum]MDB2016009.1 hypothetical protein [[Clostridium] symbiosum]
MQLHYFIQSIEDALSKECYLPALALTLIIPDMCAKYDYAELLKKGTFSYDGHSKNGGAYAKWYDINILGYEFPDYISTNMSIEEISKHYELLEKTTITGWQCWKLRCALLHEGNINISELFSKNDPRINFKFRISDSYCGVSESICTLDINDNVTNITVHEDLVTFCHKILAVFKNSYMNDKNFLLETEKKNINIEFEL